jgi:hypothetical protein
VKLYCTQREDKLNSSDRSFNQSSNIRRPRPTHSLSPNPRGKFNKKVGSKSAVAMEEEDKNLLYEQRIPLSKFAFHP